MNSKETHVYATLTDDQKALCHKRLESVISILDDIVVFPDTEIIRVDNTSDKEQEVYSWCYETNTAQIWDKESKELVSANKPLQIPVVWLMYTSAIGGFIIQFSSGTRSSHHFNISIQVRGNDISTAALIGSDCLEHPQDIVDRLCADGRSDTADWYTKMIIGIRICVNDHMEAMKDFLRKPALPTDTAYDRWKRPVPIEQVQKNVYEWIRKNSDRFHILSGVLFDGLTYEAKDLGTGESMTFCGNSISFKMESNLLTAGGFERYKSLVLRKLYDEIKSGSFDPFGNEEE